MNDCALQIDRKMNQNLSGSIPSIIHSPPSFSTQRKDDNLSSFLCTSVFAQIPINYEYAKKLANHSKVIGFCGFEINWTGYGSIHISKTIIFRTLSLLSAIEYQPKVFPTARSTIQLEYDSKEGSYLEIEICDKDYIITIINGSEEKEYHTESNVEVNRVIEKYHA